VSSSIFEVLITLLTVFALAFITYFTGSSKKRINKNPFASGETVPAQRVRYLLSWFFFVIAFSALDATLLLIALTAQTANYLTLISLISVLLSLLLIPWGER